MAGRPGTESGRRWRRAAAAAAVLGISSATAIGGASPASAGAVSFDGRCEPRSNAWALSGTWSGLPPNTTVDSMLIVQHAIGRYVANGDAWLRFTTDAQGTHTGELLPVSGPAYIEHVLYRNQDADVRWNPQVDTTLFRGAAHVVLCLPTWAYAPK